jgi:hypothetical protein
MQREYAGQGYTPISRSHGAGQGDDGDFAMINTTPPLRRLLGKLGEGRLRVVCLAVEAALGHDRIVRVRPVRHDRMARAVIALDHPAMITIHDFHDAEIERGGGP